MAITQKTKDEIKAKLLEEKVRLENELGQISTKNVKNPTDYQANFPDFGSSEDENAAEVTTFTDNLTLERTLESALRDTNKALENIKSGKYGTCKYCGKEIDEKRLLARPASSSCVDCKKRLTLET